MVKNVNQLNKYNYSVTIIYNCEIKEDFSYFNYFITNKNIFINIFFEKFKSIFESFFCANIF